MSGIGSGIGARIYDLRPGSRVGHLAQASGQPDDILARLRHDLPPHYAGRDAGTARPPRPDGPHFGGRVADELAPPVFYALRSPQEEALAWSDAWREGFLIGVLSGFAALLLIGVLLMLAAAGAM